jgi:hypothetical protein
VRHQRLGHGESLCFHVETPVNCAVQATARMD